MRKWKQLLVLPMVIAMAVGSLTGCSNKDNQKDTETKTEAPAADADVNTDGEAEDTITVLLPPLTPTFQDNFDKWTADFNALYPNLTLVIEPASWEDFTQKLDVQVQAGSPPDIAFVGATGIAKYIDTGLLLDIKDIMPAEMLADYDQTVLDYYRNGDGIYGVPAYAEVHGIGGNKAMLEAAGIDWQKIQQEGWTFEEFREAIKKGVIKDGDVTETYGFVFATAGVAASDYLNIFVKNAGMPDPFTKDLKYAYTSQNFLKLLESLRLLIDDGSMPKELSSVDAGMRWNMFLTGQTMITGKGISVFERSAQLNNEKIQANDGSAVEGSIEAEYIILPVPTFFGHDLAGASAIDGYGMFRGKDDPSQAHMDNVAKAMHFLSSGEISAVTCSDLYISPVTKSGQEAMANIETPEGKNELNTAAAQFLVSQIPEARPDITPEMGASAQKLADEVMIPKFQALLADEITPQQMYDAVRDAAVSAFGEEGIVND